jgi:release factor glutamine methyltransferase
MKQNVWQKLDSRTELPDGQPPLKWVQHHISPHSDSPLQDSLVLLSWITGLSKEKILAYPEIALDQDQISKLSLAVKKYNSGFPLPYITGVREFQKLTFQVNPQVLIPRPETETLVDLASTWLQEQDCPNRTLDLGTGSGCIGISLAKYHPALQIVAADINFYSLKVAKENARFHQVADQITFIQTDLLQGIFSRFDLITANLPYIPREKLARLKALRYEPQIALDGGVDGLYWIRKFLQKAPEHLNPGGAALLEIDEDTGLEAENTAREFFPQAKIIIEKDLSGLDRFLIIRTDN